MNPLSNKKALIYQNISKIKKYLVDINDNKCAFCGEKRHSKDPAHIIRRSYSLKLQDEIANIILACRRCHDIFDSNNLMIIKRLKNINFILEIMEALDEHYYYRFINNINT